MKSSALKGIVLLCSILMAGCFVPSIQSFCPDDKVVEMPELNGRWRLMNQGTEDVSRKYTKPWIFNGNEIKTYEGSVSTILNVKYFKTGDRTYADLTVKGEELSELNTWGSMHLMSVYSLCSVVVQTNGTLQFTPMDGTWLKDQLESGVTNLAPVLVRGDNLLTASSEVLYDFVTTITNAAEAFPEKSTYTFRKAASFSLLPW